MIEIIPHTSMSSNKLLKQARFFEKLAAFNFPKVVQSYKNAIQQELNAGIQNLNKIFTSDPKSGNKQSLQSLDDAFGRIGDLASKLEPVSAAGTITEMLSAIGQASFYTSPQNAGTGYDVQTRQGGAASPAASLQRIKSYLEKLKGYSDYNESLTKKPAPANVQQSGPGNGTANNGWVAQKPTVEVSRG